MENLTNAKQGEVITFYSYKGGVGRSMALANIACLLAKQNLKVLIIDWDLEAPGLDHFFKYVNNERQGLIELMININSKIKKETNPNEEFAISYLHENLNKFITKNLTVNFDNDDAIYKIDLIKSGKQDSKYSKKINDFNWLSFYNSFPSFFRVFANYLESIYDYILIDSRTGLSDTSGICTMIMPQKLVLIFVPNHQNIEGVKNVAVQALNYRLNSFDERSLSLYPLPSRIDSNNVIKRPEWLEKYTTEFQNLFNDKLYLDDCSLKNYFEKASIRYIHDYAFGEELPVLKESLSDNKNISNDYFNFLEIITGKEQIWDILNDQEQELQTSLAQKYFLEALNYKTESDYYKAIELYNKSLEIKPNPSVYNNLGIIYSLMAQETDDDNERKELYIKSIDVFKKAIKIESDNIQILKNFSLSLLYLARIKEDVDYYVENIALFKEIIKSHPKESSVHNILATSLFELGLLKQDMRLLIESLEYYRKTTKNKPDYAGAYFNWGKSLYALYNLTNNKNYLKQYNLKTKKALEIDNTLANGFYIWGESLLNIAVTTKDKKMLSHSKEILISAKKYNNKTYALACCYALLGDRLNSLENLTNSLANKEIDITKIYNDHEIWNDYLEDPKFRNTIDLFNFKN